LKKYQNLFQFLNQFYQSPCSLETAAGQLSIEIFL
jgi:hypothetical protein